MNEDELTALLADIESDRSERTVSATDTDKFGEAICAFANDLPNHRKPGYLFVGATADGRPSGLPITDQLLQNLAAIRSDGNLLPQPSLVVQRVRLAGGEMAVVEVQPSDLPPVRYKQRIWVRIGPRRGLANEQDERLLAEKRQGRSTTWDARPCPGATLDDLAQDLFVLSYRNAAVDPRAVEANHRPLPLQLAALRLYDLREPPGPTHAGLLVLGVDPLRFIPGAYVQFVGYDGLDVAAEVRVERRLTGDLAAQLRGLDDLAESLAGRHPEAAQGLAERTAFVYPPVALHELFVNAIVHRSYESTAPVLISEFTDRVEIRSPGGLYGIAPEEFPEMTGYRNPVLAEAARVYGFANRFGRGIGRAQAVLRANGSPEASFEIRQGHVNVVVRRRP